MKCKTNCLVNSKYPKKRRAKKRKLTKMWKPLEENGWIQYFGKISAEFLSHLTWSLDHALASKIWRRYASPDSNRAILRRDVDFFKQMKAKLVRKSKETTELLWLILIPVSSLSHCIDWHRLFLEILTIWTSQANNFYAFVFSKARILSACKFQISSFLTVHDVHVNMLLFD